MNETLQNLLRRATRLTQSGQLREATEAIQRALRGKSMAASRASNTANTPPAPDISDVHWRMRPGAPAPELDGCTITPERPAPLQEDAPGGAFNAGSHSYKGLTRQYKLYVPPGHTGRSLPLVVMLHGCTQNPDDFATGTRMNERAAEQGFFVLYPAQGSDANPSRCWNWFKHTHQRRDGGEAGLLANLTQGVVEQYDIDPRRVYVAGLSAGGAMAAIVADVYPELFAAVGVHSGLPRGAAGNVAEALSVMRTGAKGPFADMPGRRTPGDTLAPQVQVPTIVFHGDKDQAVHPRNGEQVIAAALAAGSGTPEVHGLAQGNPQVTQGVLDRPYTHTVHRGPDGEIRTEHWLVHGAGHAWSGGNGKGSYTEVQGPDATGEMLRFFFEHPGAARH